MRLPAASLDDVVDAMSDADLWRRLCIDTFDSGVGDDEDEMEDDGWRWRCGAGGGAAGNAGVGAAFLRKDRRLEVAAGET